MKHLIFLSSFLFVFLSEQSAYSQTNNGNTCQYFYERLKDLPNEKLSRKKGIIIFSWDKQKYQGCKINFVTNDSLLAESPSLSSFWPKKDTALYQSGWRYNLNYDADGPGSTVFGIEKGDTLCLIGKSQPATLVAPGKIERSSTLTFKIECRIK